MILGSAEETVNEDEPYISDDPSASSNPFYNTVPPGCFWPSLIVAILAPVLLYLLCRISPDLFSYSLDSRRRQGRCNRPQSQGQSGLAQHDWPSTIDYYTKAIEKHDAGPSLYCNQAQANIKLEAYGYAIADATKAIELDMSGLSLVSSVTWVLVTQSLGALGSVGTQQAKNVYGAGKVFTTVSTPKVPLVETYTPSIVDKVIDYFQERLGLITAITQAVLTVSSNYDHLCIQRKEAGKSD
ncbi:hypothetical protein Z517_09332 [Fonsecaea pedrosoi CBS 271.37]|uniref:Uncharacterized protein n=1 Tax=Fonsecaea pedrosoi CBS 271.37 TaxID=1442368 RepID=A0A0D2G876_9EURO|nr:uncharacterized protein Z517_09332 [Fonsecaea pedrosoi CBS 271.37]KIW76888.1 hypothetical protein Z517_09332 [Fonsecaea pedrosoi CBS 271.37]